ncbi:MAG: DUF2283 domain-containing protein [Leptolyngbyaceae cyanobacterium SM2_5_2]|nr:DUF2283 domain-containing protein [Leptolyngbyaceae cyanobacterium SM2_5_2]
MALTQVNVDSYLKVAKALQTVEPRPCWMMFDAEADLFYINFYEPARPATDSEVTDDDVVIRYADNEVIGLTILSVSQR